MGRRDQARIRHDATDRHRVALVPIRTQDGVLAIGVQAGLNLLDCGFIVLAEDLELVHRVLGEESFNGTHSRGKDGPTGSRY